MIKPKLNKRINDINKQIYINNKPNLVMIFKEKQGWKITEHYYKPKYQVSFKNYFYADYNDYLDKVDLGNNTPVIVNDLPIGDD